MRRDGLNILFSKSKIHVERSSTKPSQTLFGAGSKSVWPTKSLQLIIFSLICARFANILTFLIGISMAIFLKKNKQKLMKI